MLRKLRICLSSNAFFYGVLAFFTLQALWIALSASYPMAFDEDFHFGIIQLYAHHLSPFWAAQPPDASVYGAVFRDPSYLYHYLMSFPYHLLTLITSSQTAQIIVLRVINIGLLVGALAVWRKLLLNLTASRALVHGVLLVYVLIPVVPFLAAQINYDNLFILLVGWALLLALRFYRRLGRGPGTAMPLALGLLALCLLTSLVKYAFLPIFAVLLVSGVVVGYQRFGRDMLRQLGRGIRNFQPTLRNVALVLLLLVALVLFLERYGVNTVRYHTPLPDCGKVLSIDECSQYGPWRRDYGLSQSPAPVPHNPILYADDWLSGMFLRLFFTLAGPDQHFQTELPLLLPCLAALAATAAGIAALALRGRRTLRTGPWLPVLAAVAVYILAVYYTNYEAYVRTGAPVAINGRYLLPVLPVLMLAAGLALSRLLGRYPRVRLTVAVVLIGGFFWGGGTFTFIVRSHDSWLWPNSLVRQVNSDTRRWLSPAMPDGDSLSPLWP